MSFPERYKDTFDCVPSKEKLSSVSILLTTILFLSQLPKTSLSLRVKIVKFNLSNGCKNRFHHKYDGVFAHRDDLKTNLNVGSVSTLELPCREYDRHKTACFLASSWKYLPWILALCSLGIRNSLFIDLWCKDKKRCFEMYWFQCLFVMFLVQFKWVMFLSPVIITTPSWTTMTARNNMSISTCSSSQQFFSLIILVNQPIMMADILLQPNNGLLWCFPWWICSDKRNRLFSKYLQETPTGN